MSLFNVFSVSGSAMESQSIRLNTIASNLANIDTVSTSKEGAYRSLQPVFKTILADNLKQNSTVGGVKVNGIVKSNAHVEMRFSPNHPLANEDGYVFGSNVNLVSELANMATTKQSITANINTIATAKQLLIRTIQLGQR